MKKFRLKAIIILLIISNILSLNAQPNYEKLNQQIDKLFRILATAKENYLEDIDEEKLVTEAIKASLKQLDPHSIYLPPKKLQDENEKFKGSFDGIGVQFSVIDDTINIITAIPGGPSEKLGIISGDKIVKIEGQPAIGLDNDSIQSLLRGPKGTKVTVEILRYGEPELLKFEIIRDKIPLYSVNAAFVIQGTDIGYISINRFMQTTHEEFVDSMEVLKSKGMKKVIIDLRGNPGGYMNQAIDLVDEFVKEGHKILFTKGRKPEFNEEYYSKPNGRYEDLPLIVLIDAGSASASEIFSGAIQDLDRGIVVGVTSYGKGLVQRQYTLPDRSGFRITIAKYYTPSGRCIQRPYKDENKYRNMEGWLSLKEGENINHALEEYEFEGDSLPPIFETIGGRKVLGGGGIVPDFVVKYDTITKLSRLIRSKNLFFIYARNYLGKSKEEFNRFYGNDFDKFLNEFKMSDEMLDDFKELVEDKGIEWNEDEYEKDEKYLQTSIKSSIARSVWGESEAVQAYLPMIKQVQKALELFPLAKEISKLDE